MRVLQRFQTTEIDVDRVRQLLVDRKEDPYVCERMKENVLGPAPKFDGERFWYVLIGCLLTTQQKSTAGHPVDRFLSLSKFPLTLAHCQNEVEEVVKEALTKFGGIRMAPTIGHRAGVNHAWLEKDCWPRVERWFGRLAAQRACSPEVGHAKLERDAARFAEVRLTGIGPKQSRNLWQWLGLTRYETPLDSRVVGWINTNLSVKMETEQLGDQGYYECVMDYVQEVCRRAGVLPCMWDAAAFDNSNTLRDHRACGGNWA
jgi:hypothetical protein